jgi:hypothetical protein
VSAAPRKAPTPPAPRIVCFGTARRYRLAGKQLAAGRFRIKVASTVLSLGAPGE